MSKPPRLGVKELRQQSVLMREIALSAAKESVRLSNTSLLSAALAVLVRHGLMDEFAQEHSRILSEERKVISQ